MRKLLLFLVLCFSASSMYAQQADNTDEEGRLLSKRGQVIQPSAGNFSLGFNAQPFLDYVGNIFTGGLNEYPDADFINGQVLGKYFLSDNKAIRVRGRINQDVTTNRSQVVQDIQPTPNPNAEVTDQHTIYNTDVRLGAGMEFRRGEGRVVGVYGAEASVLFGNTSDRYSYGNSMTLDNQAPSSAFEGTTADPDIIRINDGRYERLVKGRTGRYLGFGVSGFAGVEYFIAPKLSMGAEFALGLDLTKDYSSKHTYEHWNSGEESTQTRTYVAEDNDAGGSDIGLSTGNYQGAINLMFYF